MTAFTFGNMTFGLNLEALLNEAKAYARIAGYAALGTSTTAQNTLAAGYVNQAMDWFLAAAPRLGLKTANQAVVSGTMGYAVPADMQDAEIKRIYYSDTGSDETWDLYELEYLNSLELSRLEASARNGTETAEHPWAWGYNKDRTQVEFYPMPSASQTVVIEYRQKPTQITYSNVASPSSVTISEIPARFGRVMAVKVASLLCMMDKPALSEGLAAMASGMLAEVIEAFRDRRPMRRDKGWMDSRNVFKFQD